MNIALMRQISSSISQCEITNISRKPIDPEQAKKEHAHYADVLRDFGYKIHMLEADEDLPDSVFIEDTAVVLEEIAVITHPGAASRRNETKAVAEALSIYRDLEFIGPTGTLDGGDVIQMGRTFYVGKSCRSSAVGISLLREIVRPHGYDVIAVPVTGCLHLKSAASIVHENTVLLNPNWVDPAVFQNMEVIEVDPSEPYGANSQLLEDGLIYSTSFPRTREKLQAAGIEVTSIDISELSKAEGNISCICLLFAL